MLPFSAWRCTLSGLVETVSDKTLEKNTDACITDHHHKLENHIHRVTEGEREEEKKNEYGNKPKYLICVRKISHQVVKRTCKAKKEHTSKIKNYSKITSRWANESLYKYKKRIQYTPPSTIADTRRFWAT